MPHSTDIIYGCIFFIRGTDALVRGRGWDRRTRLPGLCVADHVANVGEQGPGVVDNSVVNGPADPADALNLSSRVDQALGAGAVKNFEVSQRILRHDDQI